MRCELCLAISKKKIKRFKKDFVYVLGGCTTSGGCTSTLDIYGDVFIVGLYL